MMTPDGAKTPRTTDFGKSFLAFITQPWKDAQED
jgi:hypothetical protein